MIKAMHVTICDGCGKFGPAREEGTQRDSSWVAPPDWAYGKYNHDVHFCPECAKKLSWNATKPNQPVMRTTVDAMLE